ncbi:MAG: Spy/CpxP family protein refolding chaperone [Thermoguttaceae bacterium]
MMRRVLLSSVLLATVATVAFAAEPKAEPVKTAGTWSLVGSPLGHVISGCVGRYLVLHSEINITAEQKAKIQEVLMSHRSQIAATVKSVRDKRVVLRKAVLSGKADEAQIRAAADELGKAISDAAVKASKLRNEIVPILTEDQCHLIGKFLNDNDAAIDKFLDDAAKGQ